jgi:hypothetical protein
MRIASNEESTQPKTSQCTPTTSKTPEHDEADHIRATRVKKYGLNMLGSSRHLSTQSPS